MATARPWNVPIGDTADHDLHLPEHSRLPRLRWVQRSSRQSHGLEGRGEDIERLDQRPWRPVFFRRRSLNIWRRRHPPPSRPRRLTEGRDADAPRASRPSLTGSRLEQIKVLEDRRPIQGPLAQGRLEVGRHRAEEAWLRRTSAGHSHGGQRCLKRRSLPLSQTGDLAPLQRLGRRPLGEQRPETLPPDRIGAIRSRAAHFPGERQAWGGRSSHPKRPPRPTSRPCRGCSASISPRSTRS